LRWQAVSGALDYRVVTGWKAEGAASVTETEFSTASAADGQVYMVYALDREGNVLAAEGALTETGSEASGDQDSSSGGGGGGCFIGTSRF